MGAHRGTRCPLRVARHRVSDEVLVVSGAGSRERGPAAAGALWLPDYKAGPARGPIWARAAGATASHWNEKPRQLPLFLQGECVIWCVCVGVCGCKVWLWQDSIWQRQREAPSPHKRFFRESHKYRGLLFKRAAVMASKWWKWLPSPASKPPHDHH